MTRFVNQKSIRVVLAADSRFVMPLSVAMSSAALNCDPQRNITFYVLQHDIGTQLRQQVERSLASTGHTKHDVVWLDVSFANLDQFKTHGHFNAMTYARLLIPSLLPLDVEKVLYLDSDLVVVGDIAELWDLECGEKTLLAAQDRIVESVSGFLGLSNYRDLGIPADSKYFNAGVLLINLKKWRSDKVSDKVFEYLRQHQKIIRMVDQEALNAVLFDSWGQLECRWNWQVGRLNPFWPSKRTSVAPEGGAEKSIIHFTTAVKPWLPGCRYEEKRVFFEYLDLTEWAGWRVPLSREAMASCRSGAKIIEQIVRRLGGRALRTMKLRRPYVKQALG